MTLRERIARKLHELYVFGLCSGDYIPFDEGASAWLSEADAILAEMRGDPGHDATAGICAPGQDRTPFLNVWNGIIDAALAEKDG